MDFNQTANSSVSHFFARSAIATLTHNSYYPSAFCVGCGAFMAKRGVLVPTTARGAGQVMLVRLKCVLTMHQGSQKFLIERCLPMPRVWKDCNGV
jgi:hypothetical protein